MKMLTKSSRVILAVCVGLAAAAGVGSTAPGDLSSEAAADGSAKPGDASPTPVPLSGGQAGPTMGVAKGPIPHLLISLRTDKAIYKDGERVRLLGEVINGSGTASVASVVDLSVYRSLPAKGAGDRGSSAKAQQVIVYRSLLEPKNGRFDDDGYVIRFPAEENGSMFGGAQADFVAEATVRPRLDAGTDENDTSWPYAQTTFGAEQVSGLNVIILLTYPSLFVIATLVLVYRRFQDASVSGVFRTLYLVYAVTLLSLLGALVGPLIVSASPAVEALLRSSPVGIAKAASEKNEVVQWMVNFGGVLGSDDVFRGGFSIPFFVLVMALIGGAISMLITMPRFLRESAALSIIDAVQADGERNAKAAELRGAIFQQFIYIVTAPFLGMVVFSMATLADYKNAFALSILAFAVGFTSEQIVKRMVAFTGKVLEPDHTGERRDAGRAGAEPAEERQTQNGALTVVPPVRPDPPALRLDRS